MPTVQVAPIIGLLGPVSIADENGQMRPVPGIRARRLLAVLALTPGSQRSQSALIDGVWGEKLPRSPQSALHTQISRLRPLLPDGAIEAGPLGYRLTLGPDAIDVFAAQSLLADGSAEALGAAAALWRGEPGDDLGDDELASSVRQSAARLHDDLDDHRSRKALSDGDFDAARAFAQARCDADPLDESAHATLIRALSGLGREPEALAVFARLRRTLSAELGADPGPEITALHQQILTRDTPAPTAGTARPQPRAVGLSAEPNTLLGRDLDVQNICDLLKTSRVVTVQGPGGAGKTRIANRIGHLVADEDVRVYFVELASVRGGDDVLAVVAATLGVGESDVSVGGRPKTVFTDLRTRLADALTADTLVVLDNCEHVIDAAATLTADLIAAADTVRVLTTSRSPLALTAESVYELPPLPIDESGSAATDLFNARAHAIRPGVVTEPALVARLCRALDGLPLAIELAAARVRTMSVQEIYDGLSARFVLLRSGDRSSPTRHRTLHAVIEWSWALLDDSAQAALAQLCRFPGGFSREAAAAVTGLSGPALDDDLEALVNQSLLGVTESGTVRYRMLETVREFGEEKLTAAGTGERVDAAMTRWATEYTRRLLGPFLSGRQAASMAALGRDSDNLVWVLRRCLDPDRERRPAGWTEAVVNIFAAVAGFWAVRGLHAEVGVWGPRVINALPLITPEDAAAMDDTQRETWQVMYVFAGSHLLFAADDLWPLARARARLRTLHRPDLFLESPLDFVSSIALARSPTAAMRVLVAGRGSSNPLVGAVAVTLSSNLRENLGDLDGAMRDALLTRDLADARDDQWSTAVAQLEIASILGQSGDYESAVQYYRHAVKILSEVGADQDSRQTMGYVVAALIGAGRLDEARRAFAEFARGWQPVDPDPREQPEVSSGIMLCAAELAHEGGDNVLEVEMFTRAAAYLIAELSFPRQDPAGCLALCAAVAGLVRAGEVDAATPGVERLLEYLDYMFGRTGAADIPQAGSAALCLGAVLSVRQRVSEDGARLMLLSRRLRGRRDYPAMRDLDRDSRRLSGLTDVAWEQISESVAPLSRRQAAVQLVEITQRAFR
ncbi:putative ATPase [Williamsia limnetica]|uniref:Putative ATPase n=1 Tax=Williamsia limnetica TaxID=882452 RepID=A0A318RNB5_WILLI|nr:BTAD domain-containing putative transcriptional regulator [Williamsia limnetica]PYE20125.1 putative ATPase [Williamsia limnetica]